MNNDSPPSDPSILLSLWNRIDKKPLVSRLARGAFWNLTGTAVLKGLTLIAFMLAARELGQKTFGELGIVQSTVAMFTIFATFRLGMTATKYTARYRVTERQKAGNIIGLSFLMSLVAGLAMTCILACLSTWMASSLLKAPHLSCTIAIASPILLLASYADTQNGILVGLEAFKTIARLNLITGVARFSLVVAGSVLYGLNGAVSGLLISHLLTCMINYCAVNKALLKTRIHISWSNIWSERRILWSFSLPAMLGGIMVAPVFWACHAMLVNQENGYIQMGILNAATQWRNVVIFLPGSLSAITLPILASLHEERNAGGYRKILKYNLILNASACLIVALPVALSANFVMQGYGFDEGSWVLILTLVSAILTATLAVVGQAIISGGNMWWAFGLNAIWATVMLTTSYYLVRYGALGLAIASCISYLVHLISAIVYTLMFITKNRNYSNA